MASGPSSPQSPVTQEIEKDQVTQDCLQSLERLSGDTHNLQKLLCFFDSCAVDETVLTRAIAAKIPQEFEFLFNKMKLALRII